MPQVAKAQMPSHEEFEAAVAAARPAAAASGLSLHTADLWALLLKARAPMLARVAGRRCHVGYSAYTPGRDFSWLFPVLGAHERQVWLQALVQHEVAHCADETASSALPSGAVQTAQRKREAYADLAFALHVDAHVAVADTLIETLAALRSRMAASDPEHDTAAVLRCYLAHPMRAVERGSVAAEWRVRLATWQQRCWQEPGRNYAAR